jgi:hypothetical protein
MGLFELLAKELGTPVLCADGSVGMLVRYPDGDAATDYAGIEVPGETDLRWIVWPDLLPAGSALRQKGSPSSPLSNWHQCALEHTAMSRQLLSELWIAVQPTDAQRPAGGIGHPAREEP